MVRVETVQYYTHLTNLHEGKHDVGSLSHKGRHSSLGSRFGSYSMRHSHAHPRAAPTQASPKA